MIKTYRGVLDGTNPEAGQQDQIRLKTLKGDIGYRIAKLQAFPSSPGTSNYEALISVWKLKQSGLSTDTPTADFTDGDLLGVVWIEGASSNVNADTMHVIFDKEIFNQDIYITCVNTETGLMNYYLELEQVTLNENESTMATLQSLRQIAEN